MCIDQSPFSRALRCPTNLAICGVDQPSAARIDNSLYDEWVMQQVIGEVGKKFGEQKFLRTIRRDTRFDLVH
jgi:hypothetical protein